MRRRNGFRAAVLTACLSAAAAGQDGAPKPAYWPLRKIDFPVPVADIQREARRPKLLRFFVARPGERFDQVSEKEPDKLPVLNAARNQRGFSYTAPTDGVYDFAVQFVYPDGSTEPRDSNLVPEWRITFDTRPPVLEVRQSTPTRLEWEATDDNLAPNPVTVETRWPGGRWKPVEGKKFAARDGYTWQNLKENDPLEVRVIARDKGGLEFASRVFSLPGRGSDGGRLPAAPNLDDPPPRAGSGFGSPSDFEGTGTTPTDYRNNRDLKVVSKLQRVTRSGVKKAYLWVTDGKTGWKQAGEREQNIPGGSADAKIEMDFKAPADGLYGFVVIPESHAGTRVADPTSATPPQYQVYVDTVPPTVQIKRADVTPGGAAGPRVVIEWAVTETGSGLQPESIQLEYADASRPDVWQKITPGKIENSGRHTWEVEDKALWKCRIRATATDRAGNSGTHSFDKDVFLDLEKPAAVIEKVVGGEPGGAPPPAAPAAPAPGYDTKPNMPPPGGGPTVPPINPSLDVPPVPGRR